MGRHRREPKDNKEAKELERLRKNQAACRKRRLEKIDEYKQTINVLEEQLKQKFQEQTGFFEHINDLRAQMAQMEQNIGATPNHYHFESIVQRVDQIRMQVEQMKIAMKPANVPDPGPSTSQ